MRSRGIQNVATIAFASLSGERDNCVQIAALSLELDGTGQPVKRVRLIPMGRFKARDGREFEISSLAHAKAIVKISQDFAGAQDIPVDYDHQISYGAVEGVGGQAPASGWIKPASLSAEADGIYGEVEWTPKATAAIADKEYRYLSPDIAYDPKSRRVLRLNHAGLTNTPAIDGLTTLAASLSPQKDSDMNLSALAVSLGLPADAALAQIEAAQLAQAASLSTLLTSIGAVDATAALSALNTLKAGPKAGEGQTVVATDMLTSMQTQLSTLTNASNETTVDAAIAAGRVIPAQREHYLKMMRTDPTTALALMNSNMVVVSNDALSGRPGAASVTSLSIDQKAVCKAIGVSEADYLKTLQENAA